MPVTLTDALRIEPPQMTFAIGQPVTFVITNSGGIVHEFFVGDADAQAASEAQLVDPAAIKLTTRTAGAPSIPARPSN